MLERHVIVVAGALALASVNCGGSSGNSEGAADATSATISSPAASAAHPLIGKAAPDVPLEAVGGSGPKTLAAAQGKVVILDFWGTFCEPCKKSFPKYQEIADQFAGDVAVLAVSVDDPDSVKKDNLLTFAKENHAKFAIVWDKDHKAAKKYGLESLTMPTSFVIDKNGTVRHLHVGFHDGEEAKIAAEVKALLK